MLIITRSEEFRKKGKYPTYDMIRQANAFTQISFVLIDASFFVNNNFCYFDYVR
jgi:hypothetical protein